jgi:CRP-like cAMP-binding protein
MSVPVTLIQQFPFFDGLSQAELSSLASISQLVSAKTNQEILSPGSLVQYLSFVVTGELQKNELASEGRIVSLAILGPGDLLGLLALADEKPITYSVRTLSNCNLLVVPMEHARNLSFSNPLIRKRVFAMLAALVHRANEERAMLSLPNAFHRIFAQLQLLTQAPSRDPAVKVIPKQQDIANMVNTSRETVSRALQTLIKLGILSKTGHQIHIQQSHLLERLAAQGPNALESDPAITDTPKHQDYINN